MTLRTFLNAAYAVLVAEYQRIGKDILTAVEEVNQSIGLTPVTDGPTVPSGPSAADNDRALAELNKLMAGVKKA